MLERDFFNLGVREARRFQRRLRELDGCSRIISDGRRLDLERLLTESLLGLRTPGCRVNLEKLTPSEHKLRRRQEWKVATVLDYDGVLAEPLKAALRFLREPRRWKAGLRRLEQVPLKRWELLMLVIQASDSAYLHTSRRVSLKEAPWWWRVAAPMERFGCYPFLGPEVRNILSTLKGYGLRVLTGKPFDDDLRCWQEIIASFDMTYIVGSSLFDRRKALRLAEAYPELVPKFVFFDTGGLFL